MALSISSPIRLVFISALSLALSACGGGGGSPAPVTPPTPPAPTVFLPVNPVPSTLWSPAAGATPAVGNYVYLQSESGDTIGTGQSGTYSRANANLAVSASGGKLTVSVDGDQAWTGTFQAMSNLAQFQTGQYADLKHFPDHDAAKGGLDWSGDGHVCGTASGWFAIDKISYTDGAVTALDLRFEQRCNGATPALHGAVHWTAVDAAPVPAIPGPVLPVPAGLWSPAPGTTPASGNYIYLQGQTGDYILGQQSYTYTQSDAIINFNPGGGYLAVGVRGDQDWSGDFQAMSSVGRLRRGYYGNLTRYPFHLPETGGLSWGGEGRGCNTLTGWFVVDDVKYVGNTMKSIDLRFEQHCEGGPSAAHGQIHWNADAAAVLPGPVTPVPATLWSAPASALPASGNYVYLQSDAGDYIGGGKTALYTPPSTTFNVTGSNGYANVRLSNSSFLMLTGDFQAMSGAALQVGYYAGLQRYPFQNPAKGGLSWSGDGRGCNTLTGWFAIDSISYVGGELAAIDLRFEQHCEGGLAALHGQVHWTK